MTTARFDRVSLNENQSYHNSQLEKKRKISQGANEDIEYQEQTAWSAGKQAFFKFILPV